MSVIGKKLKDSNWEDKPFEIEEYSYESEWDAPEQKPYTERFQELLDKEEKGEELDLYEWQVVRQVTAAREKKGTRRDEKELHSTQDWKEEKKEDENFAWIKLQEEESWKNPVKAAHCCKEGMRTGQEDAYTVTANKRFRVFAVFDGHAGDAASNYLSDHVGPKLFEAFGKNEGKLKKEKDFHKLVDQTITALDKDLYEKLDGEDAVAGATMAMAIQDVDLDRVTIAHLGDSRATLFTPDQNVIYQTSDQKPDDDDEKHRIEKAGGHVMHGRVNGDLAVARALGDFKYKTFAPKGQNKWYGGGNHKENLVSNTCEIQSFDIKDKKDVALLIACDGVYDVFAHGESKSIPVKLVTAHLFDTNNRNGRTDEKMMRKAADSLTLLAFDRASGDNITALVAMLN